MKFEVIRGGYFYFEEGAHEENWDINLVLNKLERLSKITEIQHCRLGIPHALYLILKDRGFPETSVEIIPFLKLNPGTNIEDLIESENPENKILHILPDPKVKYNDFRDSLWDLHLEGYEIWFHYTDHIEEFIARPKYFQKLAHRGVKIGVSGKAQGLFSTWNPKKNIPRLILELSIHFFDRAYIDPEDPKSEEETTLHLEILSIINPGNSQ